MKRVFASLALGCLFTLGCGTAPDTSTATSDPPPSEDLAAEEIQFLLVSLNLPGMT